MTYRFFIGVISICFIFVYSHAFGDVVLYLKSNVKANDKITIADIALVDGDEDIKSIKNIELPESSKRDGYFTKDEVFQCIKNYVKGLTIIHGYSVKMITGDGSFSNSQDSYNELSPMMKRRTVSIGDYVMVKLIKKSIAIELMGRSLQSGTTGDEITVTLQNGKVVTGTIHNDAIECKL